MKKEEKDKNRLVKKLYMQLRSSLEADLTMRFAECDMR